MKLEDNQETRERLVIVPVFVLYDIVMFYTTDDRERGSPGPKEHVHMCILVDLGMVLL